MTMLEISIRLPDGTVITNAASAQIMTWDGEVAEWRGVDELVRVYRERLSPPKQPPAPA